MKRCVRGSDKSVDTRRLEADPSEVDTERCSASRAVFLVGAALCVCGPPAYAATPQQLRVAAFRCEITPRQGEPLIWDVPLTKVESALRAKGAVLQSGRQRYVLCAFDWCEIGNESELAFRKVIAKAARTKVSNVALHCVHQHSAPYADRGAHKLLDAAPSPPLHLSDRFLNEVSKRLTDAVRSSLTRLQPFDQIGTGEANVQRVASTRRLHGDEGRILVRYSTSGKDPKLADAPEGFVDPFLKTITLAYQGKPLVRLHYYATHPQTFCCDGRASSDFVGQSREALEQSEQVPQIYFTGCSGDVTVGKYNDGTPRAQTELAERLLAAMQSAIASTRWAPAGTVQWRTTPLMLPLRTNVDSMVAACRSRIENTNGSPGSRVYEGAMRMSFAKRIRRPLDLSSVQIGNMHILHLPGEPMLEFQMFAQRSRPESFVAVAGYCDCGPGYICTDQALTEGGYEPGASNVGAGSEARLKEAIRHLLGTNPRRPNEPREN